MGISGHSGCGRKSRQQDGHRRTRGGERAVWGGGVWGEQTDVVAQQPGLGEPRRAPWSYVRTATEGFYGEACPGCTVFKKGHWLWSGGDKTGWET